MTSSTADDSLPFGKSHWDKLPRELHDMVLGHAGKLTLFLNQRLPKEFDKKTMFEILLEALDIDWPGDFSTLPTGRYGLDCFIHNEHLSQVNSRHIYERLCQRFPYYTEANSDFVEWDTIANKKTRYVIDDCLCINHIPCLRFLHIPMRNMWLDVIQESIDTYPYARAADCIAEGHDELLWHLIRTRKVNPRKIRMILFDKYCSDLSMNVVAASGRLDTLKMLHEAGNNSINHGAMNQAALNGHLHVVKWLHENRSEGCTKNAMNYAVENGHLDIVKFLHEHRREGCSIYVMDFAAKNGHLDVIQWLYENRREGCTKDAMDKAASNGHLDVVKWLHENRKEGCTTGAMDEAAKMGYLDIVKYLHESRTEGCTTKAMDQAASNGHFGVVYFLQENRTEGCTVDAMNWAAYHGHLDVVKFLLENRKEGFTRWAINQSKSDGHDEIVGLLESHRHLLKN